jgi:hypothetical protein
MLGVGFESGSLSVYSGVQHTLRTRTFAGFMAMSMSVIPGSGPSISAPTCPIPSQNSVEAVTELMDNPPILPGQEETDDIDINQALQEEAAHLHLHFANISDSLYWSLEGGVSAGPTSPEYKPFEDYADAAEAILEQSGVTLHVGAVPDSPYTTQAPTSGELDTPQAKQAVMLVMQTFTEAPEELTRDIPITDVYMTAHASRNDPRVVTKGFAEQDQGVMAIDVTAVAEGDYITAPHEYGHFIKKYRCGGAIMSHNDPRYVALNRESSYANEFPFPDGFLQHQPKSFEAIAPTYYKLNSEINEARKTGDQELVRELNDQMDSLVHDVEMQSDYSYATPDEGDAELGKQILTPRTYDTELDPRMPVRRQKFLYQLAGLYERNRAVVIYYAYEYGLLSRQNNNG